LVADRLPVRQAAGTPGELLTLQRHEPESVGRLDRIAMLDAMAIEASLHPGVLCFRDVPFCNAA
jgi:hypothetical protein